MLWDEPHVKDNPVGSTSTLTQTVGRRTSLLREQAETIHPGASSGGRGARGTAGQGAATRGQAR